MLLIGGASFASTLRVIIVALILCSFPIIGKSANAIISIDVSNKEDIQRNGLGLRITGEPGLYEVYTSTNTEHWLYLGSVEIAPNQTTASFFDEDAQGFGSRFYKLHPIGSHTQTTLNNIPVVGIQTSRSMASEYGEIPAIFFISRSQGHTGKLTVGLRVSGEAEPFNDFRPIPKSVTIPAGQNNVKLYVYPKMDGISEGDELIQLAIEERGYYQLSEAYKANAWISDHDYLTAEPINDVQDGDESGDPSFIQKTTFADGSANIQIEISQNQVEEGSSDMVMLVISRQGNNFGELPVNIEYSGSAIPGYHYGRLPTHVRFSSNNDVINVPVFIIDDTTHQDSRSLVVKLSPSPGYHIFNPAGVQLNISDNDPASIDNHTSSLIVDAGNQSTIGVDEWLQLNGVIKIDGATWVYDKIDDEGFSENDDQFQGNSTPVILVEAGNHYSTVTGEWMNLSGLVEIDGQLWDYKSNESGSVSSIGSANNEQDVSPQITTNKVPLVEAGDNLSTDLGNWLELNASVQVVDESV